MTRAQQRRIERLEQEVLGAKLDAAHHRVHLAHRRDDDHRQIGRELLLAQRGEDAEAVEFRHHDVEQHEVVGLRLDGGERQHAVLGLIDVGQFEALEAAQQQVAVLRDVIDHQDVGVLVDHAADCASATRVARGRLGGQQHGVAPCEPHDALEQHRGREQRLLRLRRHVRVFVQHAAAHAFHHLVAMAQQREKNLAVRGVAGFGGFDQRGEQRMQGFRHLVRDAPA